MVATTYKIEVSGNRNRGSLRLRWRDKMQKEAREIAVQKEESKD